MITRDLRYLKIYIANSEEVKSCLAGGLNPNEPQDAYRESALMHACHQGAVESVKLLLLYSANIEYLGFESIEVAEVQTKKKNALDIARQYKKNDVVQLLEPFYLNFNDALYDLAYNLFQRYRNTDEKIAQKSLAVMHQCVKKLAVGKQKNANFKLEEFVFPVGSVLDKNDVQSINYLRLAAEAEDGLAIGEITCFYRYGRAITINLDLALEWVLKSLAIRGYAKQFELDILSKIIANASKDSKTEQTALITLVDEYLFGKNIDPPQVLLAKNYFDRLINKPEAYVAFFSTFEDLKAHPNGSFCCAAAAYAWAEKMLATVPLYDKTKAKVAAVLQKYDVQGNLLRVAQAEPSHPIAKKYVTANLLKETMPGKKNYKAEVAWLTTTYQANKNKGNTEIEHLEKFVELEVKDEEFAAARIDALLVLANAYRDSEAKFPGFNPDKAKKYYDLLPAEKKPAAVFTLQNAVQQFKKSYEEGDFSQAMQILLAEKNTPSFLDAIDKDAALWYTGFDVVAQILLMQLKNRRLATPYQELGDGLNYMFGVDKQKSIPTANSIFVKLSPETCPTARFWYALGLQKTSQDIQAILPKVVGELQLAHQHAKEKSVLRKAVIKELRRLQEQFINNETIARALAHCYEREAQGKDVELLIYAKEQYELIFKLPHQEEKAGAANHDDQKNYTQICYQLGALFAADNSARAIEYYNIADKNGDLRASCDLAELYSSGRIEINYPKVQALYLKVIQQAEDKALIQAALEGLQLLIANDQENDVIKRYFELAQAKLQQKQQLIYGVPGMTQFAPPSPSAAVPQPAAAARPVMI